MKALLALCVAAAAFPARAEGFGVEAGAGVAYGAGAVRDAFAPALSVRVDYGSPYYSAGIRGLLFPGSAASDKPGGSRLDASGFQAWAALAEVSMFTPGAISFGVHLAAGVGKLISLNCDCEEMAPLHGHVAPVLLGSLFASGRVGDHSRLSLELAALHFADLENGSAPFSQPATGLDAWSVAILLGIRWAER